MRVKPLPAKKVVTSVTFATIVSIGLLLAGSACFAATVGTPAEWIGVMASSCTVGLSGVYVGSMARRRHRAKHR